MNFRTLCHRLSLIPHNWKLLLSMPKFLYLLMIGAQLYEDEKKQNKMNKNKMRKKTSSPITHYILCFFFLSDSHHKFFFIFCYVRLLTNNYLFVVWKKLLFFKFLNVTIAMEKRNIALAFQRQSAGQSMSDEILRDPRPDLVEVSTGSRSQQKRRHNYRSLFTCAGEIFKWPNSFFVALLLFSFSFVVIYFFFFYDAHFASFLEQRHLACTICEHFSASM